MIDVRRLAILFLAVGLAVSTAEAKTKHLARAKSTALDNTDDFKSLGRSIPNSLIAMGYSHIGRIDIQQLVSAMDQVDVKVVPWVATTTTLDGVRQMQRNSGRWDRTVDGARIQYTSRLWKQTPIDARPVLALHEYMGATGLVSDEGYEASVGMFFLSQPETQQILRATEVSKLSNVISNQAMGSGSITGVGGGGDEYGVFIKMRYMHTILTEVKNDQDPDRRDDDVNAFIGSLFDRDEIERGGHL